MTVVYSMPIFFIEQNITPNATIQLDAKTSHHLCKVLRHQVGDSIQVCSVSEPKLYTAKILQAGRLTTLNILHQLPSQFTPILPVQINLALIAQDRLTWLVEKLTELGCQQLNLFPAQHSSHVWKSVDIDKKISKLKILSQETQKQCERFTPLTIMYFKNMDVLCKNQHAQLSNSAVLVERHTNQTIAAWCQAKPAACFWIGPEGGWHPQELAYFKNNQLVLLTAGNGILRTETAAIYAMAAMKLSC